MSSVAAAAPPITTPVVAGFMRDSVGKARSGPDRGAVEIRHDGPKGEQHDAVKHELLDHDVARHRLDHVVDDVDRYDEQRGGEPVVQTLAQPRLVLRPARVNPHEGARHDYVRED